MDKLYMISTVENIQRNCRLLLRQIEDSRNLEKDVSGIVDTANHIEGHTSSIKREAFKCNKVQI